MSLYVLGSSVITTQKTIAISKETPLFSNPQSCTDITCQDQLLLLHQKL